MAMCDLEIQLTNVDGYGDVCELDIDSRKCCRPWSLPNYVALLSNKSSCFDIDVGFLYFLYGLFFNSHIFMSLQDKDVTAVQALLQDCYEYYHSMKLSNDCVNFKCHVPQECLQHNAVYNILHFLVDIDFIKVNVSEH